MLDQRQSAPDKVIHGSVAESGKASLTRERAVRGSSEKEVSIEFDPFARGRSFLAKMIWWRDHFVGFAFSSERPFEWPASSDLGRRLRKSEKKKRQLQRRINQLLDQG